MQFELLKMKFHRNRYDMTEFTTLNMKIAILIYLYLYCTDDESQTVFSLSRSTIDHAKRCLGSSFVVRKFCLDAVTADSDVQFIELGIMVSH